MFKTSKMGLATALLAGCGLGAALPTAASADIGDFVGQWANTDRDTSGITRVEVTRRGPNLDIHVIGQCQPRDCDWGTVHGSLYAPSAGGDPVRDATAVSATFNAGFARKFIILHEARGDMLSYDVYTNFTDGSRRSDYVMQGHLRPARLAVASGPDRGPDRGPGGPGPDFGPTGSDRGPDRGPPPNALREDCTPFSAATVQVLRVAGSWKLIDRGQWVADFGDNRGDALRALDIVKNYRFNAQCFVGRPNPTMTYWKSGGTIPGGNFAGEDCLQFDNRDADVQRVQGSWKIVDRRQTVADFGNNRGQADQALNTIRTYNLNRECFVGRPNPSMVYWLSR